MIRDTSWVTSYIRALYELKASVCSGSWAAGFRCRRYSDLLSTQPKGISNLPSVCARISQRTWGTGQEGCVGFKKISRALSTRDSNRQRVRACPSAGPELADKRHESRIFPIQSLNIRLDLCKLLPDSQSSKAMNISSVSLTPVSSHRPYPLMLQP